MVYLRRRPAPLPLPLGPVIVDVDALALTEAECRRLVHPMVGGVILFARNFDNRGQLSDLCQSIHAERDEPLAGRARSQQ